MKKIIYLITVVVCTLVMSFTSFAGTWQQDEKGWHYQNDDGSYIINDWFIDLSNENTYYFDTFGYMRTGLSYIENKWYNFRDDGSLIFNYYSPDSSHISTDNGVVVSPETPGVILGVYSGATDDNMLIAFIVTNMRNVPITIGEKCEISDIDFSDTFYSYDYEKNGKINSFVIQPGETKLLVYAALDAHPVNFKVGKTTAQYNLICENEEYWIKTPICNYNNQENNSYIQYIEP